MPEIHPYARRRFIYACARIEFECFRQAAQRIVEAELSRITRAGPLRTAHGFIVKSFDDLTLQIWFGNLPTGRRLPSPESAYATEIGSTLLYSLGPRGDTAVVLYPAKSEVMKANEAFIIRALGNMSCYQLRQRIRRDLKDLVAYTYATALDGSPTFSERLRIGWIRLVCPMQIEGKQGRRATQYLFQGVGFVARSSMVAILRPVGIIVLILVLGWFGFSSFVEFLKAITLR
jgi:hypothetical protein